MAGDGGGDGLTEKRRQDLGLLVQFVLERNGMVFSTGTVRDALAKRWLSASHCSPACTPPPITTANACYQIPL